MLYKCEYYYWTKNLFYVVEVCWNQWVFFVNFSVILWSKEHELIPYLINAVSWMNFTLLLDFLDYKYYLYFIQSHISCFLIYLIFFVVLVLLDIFYCTEWNTFLIKRNFIWFSFNIMFTCIIKQAHVSTVWKSLYDLSEPALSCFLAFILSLSTTRWSLIVYIKYATALHMLHSCSSPSSSAWGNRNCTSTC